MKTSDFLKEAKSLISSREHWTQGASARTRGGFIATPYRPAAFSFCSVGALVRAADTVATVSELNEAEPLLREQMMGSIALFNDTHTHEEVLAAWDKAIAEAQRRGD